MTQHGRSQPFVQRLAKPADERSTCISTLCRLSLAGRGSAWCFALFAYALHKQPSQAQQGDGGGFRGRFLNTNGAKGVSLQDLRSLSPEYVFTFFHSRRSDVAIPATRVLRTTLHRFSAIAVPPRFSPPAHILALPVRSAVPVPAPSSRTWDSLLPSVFAVRCRLQRSDPPLPFGRTLAVGVRRCSTGERCSAARWGARRRAVRNAPRDADAVRRWGPGWLFAFAWTCRCARSVQRDPAPSGCGDASPGPGGRYGVGVARVSEGVRLRLSGVRVRRSACTYTGRSRPAAPPGHAPVPGMTLAFSPTQRVDGSCGATWGWSNRARAQRPRSRPVDRYDMCIGTGKPAPRPPHALRLPSPFPGVRTHDRDAPSVRYDGAGSVGRRTPVSLAVALGSNVCPVVVVERAWSRSGTVART